MRPRILQIVGFSAFREPASIDFDQAELVAFVGPTGSGKSSLIDAIGFALYGSISRYDDARLVEPIIHRLANEAKVLLEFELGGVKYTAIRVVRRTPAGATTKEARLLRENPDGQDVVLAGSAREMAPAVKSLLGLDFDQFTKTIVLPQGDFAAFLREDKASRQQLLRQLLDVTVYEEMGKRARAAAARSNTEAELLAAQLDKLGHHSAPEVKMLEAQAKVLAKLGPTIEDLIQVVAGARDAAESAGARAGTLEQERALLLELRVPPAVATLAAELDATDAALTEAEQSLDTARDALTAAEAARDNGPDPANTRQLIERMQRHAKLEEELTGIGEEQRPADEAESAAKAADDIAAQQLASAEEVLTRAKELESASALVLSLKVGDPCPVCRQVVTGLPDHDVSKELLVATKARRTAKGVYDQTKCALVAAAKTQLALASKREAREDELAELASAIPRKANTDALKADLLVASGFQESVGGASKATKALEATVKKFRLKQTGLRSDEQKLRKAYNDARDPVTARRPPPPGISLGVDWEALVAWAGPTLAIINEELRTEHETAKAAAAGLSKAEEQIASACSPHGISPAITGLSARLAKAAAAADAAALAARAARKQAAELKKRINELRDAHQLDTLLGRELSVAGFERWLLQEALDDLVERATERLLVLSGGQYSLISDEGDFFIRDHRNAGERRNVKTLSGGETFLASLSLALALAENIAELAAEGGPRLESMFLDEGFGTLDPETLDVVTAAMEEMSATGRLIGIVTHIRDLAERMPVRFEVRRDATTARVDRVDV